MIFHTIIVGALHVNCYIIGDEQTGEVSIIDPGDDADKILSFINKNNHKVKNIILTHGHFDHIGALCSIKEATGAEVYIHEEDSDMLLEPQKNLSLLFNFDTPVIGCEADGYLEEDDEIQLGSLTFKIFHTPGHSPGSVSILCGNILFTGDLLFKNAIGRTDLPGGDFQKIRKSLEKISLLSDDIEVLPGHGDRTNLGFEKKNNQYMI